MAGFTLNILSGKNEGLVMSPSELITNFLQGIPMCFPDGRSLNMGLIKQKLLSAQKQIENFLSIKLIKQIINGERKDYYANDYQNYGYLKTSYPINEPLALQGLLNEVVQITFVKEWLSIKRPQSIGTFRNLYILPNTGGAGAVTNANAYTLAFAGSSPMLGLFGSEFIPNYWKVTYCTGFDIIPMDIIDVLGKLAAIQVLSILGDILLGLGVASSTLSLDGLSQTIATTKSAKGGIFAGRISQYSEELKNDLANLKGQYRAITFSVG